VSAATLRAAEAARLGFATLIDASATGSIGAAVDLAIKTGISARETELDNVF
jgi:DNA repair protein RadA/Sms